MMKRTAPFFLLLLGLSQLLIAHTGVETITTTPPLKNIQGDSLQESRSITCDADFSVSLDSSNVVPNTFDFFDQSTGEPDSWFWNFGDGGTSTERNPRHQYSKAGFFKVCLTISKTIQDTIQCSDSICKIHMTSKYSDIGGHLFAGSMPINNPVSTGDTGVAVLYRIKNGRPCPVDTCHFTELGYYTFPDVLEGLFLLQVRLSSFSNHAGEFLPTYFGNVLNWKSADLLTLTDTNYFQMDIHLQPVSDTLQGPCRIKGKVLNGDIQTLVEPLSGTQVLIMNSEFSPLDYTFSDSYGNYEFPSLPFGTFNLYLESAGKYSRYTTITLDEFHPYSDTLNLQLFDHDITGISEVSDPGQLVGNVYPNPGNDRVSLNIWSTRNQNVFMSLRSCTGQVLFTNDLPCRIGLNTFPVSLTQINTGLYFLVVTRTDGSLLRAQKFLKK